MWNICILQFENSKFESWRSVQRVIKKHVKGADYGCDIGGPIHTIMFNLSISLATKKQTYWMCSDYAARFAEVFMSGPAGKSSRQTGPKAAVSSRSRAPAPLALAVLCLLAHSSGLVHHWLCLHLASPLSRVLLVNQTRRPQAPL